MATVPIFPITEVAPYASGRDNRSRSLNGQASPLSDRTLVGDAVDEALHLSLAKAGAKDALADGAIAILMKRNQFEAEKSDDGNYAVLARTSLGLASVDSVVQQFMQSDEGAAYRGKPAAPIAGSNFSRLQSELRRAH